MGECVWLYLYIHYRADFEGGTVIEWTDKAAAEDMELPISTIRYQRRKLTADGYISSERRQHGLLISIAKHIDPRTVRIQTGNPLSLSSAQSAQKSGRQSANPLSLSSRIQSGNLLSLSSPHKSVNTLAPWEDDEPLSEIQTGNPLSLSSAQSDNQSDNPLTPCNEYSEIHGKFPTSHNGARGDVEATAKGDRSEITPENVAKPGPNFEAKNGAKKGVDSCREPVPDQWAAYENHFGVKAYTAAFGKPSIRGAELIAANIRDGPIWDRVLLIWQGNSHRGQRIGDMVDRYNREVKRQEQRQEQEGLGEQGQGQQRETASDRNARRYIENLEFLRPDSEQPE